MSTNKINIDEIVNDIVGNFAKKNSITPRMNSYTKPREDQLYYSVEESSVDSISSDELPDYLSDISWDDNTVVGTPPIFLFRFIAGFLAKAVESQIEYIEDLPLKPSTDVLKAKPKPARIKFRSSAPLISKEEFKPKPPDIGGQFPQLKELKLKSKPPTVKPQSNIEKGELPLRHFTDVSKSKPVRKNVRLPNQLNEALLTTKEVRKEHDFTPHDFLMEEDQKPQIKFPTAPDQLQYTNLENYQFQQSSFPSTPTTTSKQKKPKEKLKTKLVKALKDKHKKEQPAFSIGAPVLVSSTNPRYPAQHSQKGTEE